MGAIAKVSGIRTNHAKVLGTLQKNPLQPGQDTIKVGTIKRAEQPSFRIRRLDQGKAAALAENGECGQFGGQAQFADPR